MDIEVSWNEMKASRESNSGGDETLGEVEMSLLSIAFKCPDGAEYEGELLLGKKHGKGTLRGANFVYVGKWKDDKKHGTGIMTFSNGSVYEGQFKNDFRHGFGTQQYKAGSTSHESLLDIKLGGIYEGEWKRGQKHGLGTFRYANGGLYSGQWLNGKRSGRGILSSADGSEYDGEWKNDKEHGYGIYRYGDGSSYEGQWMNGFRNGNGVFRNMGVPAGYAKGTEGGFSATEVLNNQATNDSTLEAGDTMVTQTLKDMFWSIESYGDNSDSSDGNENTSIVNFNGDSESFGASALELRLTNRSNLMIEQFWNTNSNEPMVKMTLDDPTRHLDDVDDEFCLEETVNIAKSHLERIDTDRLRAMRLASTGSMSLCSVCSNPASL